MARQSVEQNRVRFEFIQHSRRLHRLVNVGTNTAYHVAVKDEGNKVDYRDKPACNGVFAEFPSGHEEMLFALAIASNFSAVTRHNSRDKTDPEQSTRLAIAR